MRFVFCYLLCFCAVIKVAGQKTEYFEFSLPSKNISYCVFDNVEFVDSRLNQEYIGSKQKGGANKLVPVWLHGSLSNEIKTLIDSANKDVLREPHTVLINFRSFFISEYTGRFEFHAECYAKWDDGYWLVYHVDSSFKASGAGINKKVNEVVGDFINTIVHLDLSKSRRSKAVSFDYIRNIDVNEKKAIPVFNIRNPVRGLYYTYDEFKNNRPRVDVFNMVKGRNELKSVFRLPVGNKLAKKIPRDSLYAVSDGEETWLATPHEYARLNKRGLDFFFQATAYENNKIEEISLSFLFFSFPGAIIAAIPRRALFEFRLNHLNGKYILSRRAPDRN